MNGHSKKTMDLLQGDQKYVAIKALGAGTYGEVILAKNKKTSEEVAIKFMKRGPEHVTKNVLRELLTHSSLCHPHIVLFKEVFLTPSHLGLVLEYVPGGDLYHHCCSIGYLPEADARRYTQQIVVAMDYVHKMGVVNRDIKLENTLLSRNKTLVKLTDFGFAKGPEDSLPKSNVGTPNYAAPEVIRQQQGVYDGKMADVWSVGVLLYVMLFHAYPFERPGDPEGHMGFNKIMERTSRGDYQIPLKPKISLECRDFLKRCLTVEAVKRITVDQIYDHPWFAKDFPQSARTLNTDCLSKRPQAQQSQKMQNDIKYIVSIASTPPGAPRKTRGFDLDKEISQALHDEIMAGG